MSKEVLQDLKKFTDKPAAYNPHPLYDNFGPLLSKEEACRKLGLDPEQKYLLFFGFIPYAGGLILLVLMLLPGSPGENEYGPDPRYPKPAERDVLENVFS
jgi:hypothetical protein